MSFSHITPILIVDSLEDSLPFWEERLEFERLAEVTHAGRLGRVVLRHYGVELELWARSEVEDDLGLLTADSSGVASMISLDVPSLAPITTALGGCEVVVGERKTADGGREIFYREPSGQVVRFKTRPASESADSLFDHSPSS